MAHENQPSSSKRPDPLLRHPTVADGAALWRIARDSVVLDLNSPYAYLLWCRDFAATSVVADDDGALIGFVSGYRRPDDPSVFMVWQVAVDEAGRGRGVAGAMLDWVFAAVQHGDASIAYLETTITDDNTASHKLFGSFATRHATRLERTPLLDASVFPPDSGEPHESEFLHRIGPITP